MKNYVRLLLILLSGIIINIPLYAQEQAKKKVAVYMTGATSDETYKKVIGAKLVTAITESGEYAAVERTEDFLAALSAENDYQTSGEVRDSQIAKLGQKFGVRYVVVADASELFEEYFIVARLINVETGLVERAFDATGPAESMAQLITLAKDVAAGLFARQLSNLSGSSSPVHLALCVMDKNGDYKYFTSEQWNIIPEDQKRDLTKLGVCISENRDAFLVSLYENEGSWQVIDLPKIWQLKLISKYQVPLNNAMKIFGGHEFFGWYWSCEAVSLDKAMEFLVGSGITEEIDKSDRRIRRTVKALPN